MTTRLLPKAPLGDGRTLDWRRIAPVFIIVCTYAAGSAAVLPVLPFHIRAMGGSPLVLGIVIAAEGVGQFASGPTLGQLSDRFGRKGVLMTSQIIAAASLLLLALAPTIAFVLFARALFGLTAGNIAVTAAYVADHTDTGNRRQAMGILMGGAGVGGIIGAGLSGLLADISLTAPILAAFGLVLLAIVVTVFSLEGEQVAARRGDQIAGENSSLRSIFVTPAIRVLIIVMLCHFFAYGMYISQMPVFLGDTFIWNGHAFGASELSYLIMADGAINVFAQIFLLGWLGRHLSDRKLILVIFGLISTGFITAGTAATIPVLLLAVLCISTGDALAKPTYMAALSDHVPLQRQGVVMGSAQSLVAVADIASPVLGGFILGYAMYGVWIAVAVAMAVTGALVTITLLPHRRDCEP